MARLDARRRPPYRGSVDLTGLTRAQWAIVLGTLGVLLGCFVLPWYSFGVGPVNVGVSAWDSGSWGRLAAVTGLALVLGVGVMVTRNEDALPFALPTAMLAAGGLLLLFVVLQYADAAGSTGSGMWTTAASAIVLAAGAAAERRAPQSLY